MFRIKHCENFYDRVRFYDYAIDEKESLDQAMAVLSSELDEEEKKQILQDDYSIAMTKNIESGVTEMCNLSKGVEERGILENKLPRKIFHNLFGFE